MEPIKIIHGFNVITIPKTNYKNNDDYYDDSPTAYSLLSHALHHASPPSTSPTNSSVNFSMKHDMAVDNNNGIKIPYKRKY